MPSIPSSPPALSYLALPAPGAAATANARAGVPVQPVPPVTRRAERRDETGGSDQAHAQAAPAPASRPQAATATTGAAPAVSAAPGAPGAPAQSNAGFIAQRLSQESLGSGLHIEPWSAALSSYRSASALPASASRSPGVVV